MITIFIIRVGWRERRLELNHPSGIIFSPGKKGERRIRSGRKMYILFIILVYEYM